MAVVIGVVHPRIMHEDSDTPDVDELNFLLVWAAESDDSATSEGLSSAINSMGVIILAN